ncbi:MAG TPA: MBL fold metallo-hydrolase [Mucilaginibacter sp.]|jgi:beta-lactamase superfamily II metal-dependent hydrolase|nr:MBL fold metallo-hydrolase [Mucilaginibacter sp.]
MVFEIEMLSVGAADAIILRYINIHNEEVVILIDAGNKGDGETIVKRVNNYTKQKYIDLAICTHPDGDHIGGFFHVVENIRIDEFWIHDPSKHKLEIKKLREELNIDNTIEKALKYVFESLNYNESLISLIDKRKIRRDREPFAGLKYEYAPLWVVGPSKTYYELLLSRFRDVEQLFEEENLLLKSQKGGEIINEELTSRQLLDLNNDRSKENNSSVIMLFEPKEGKYLFTSDAGPVALKKASENFDLTDLDWMDVPHHGSRYNLSSEIIGILRPKVAYISCDGSKHYPSPSVIKELKKINCSVYSTATGSKIHRKGINIRPGWVSAVPL